MLRERIFLLPALVLPVFAAAGCDTLKCSRRATESARTDAEVRHLPSDFRCGVHGPDHHHVRGHDHVPIAVRRHGHCESTDLREDALPWLLKACLPLAPTPRQAD